MSVDNGRSLIARRLGSSREVPDSSSGRVSERLREAIVSGLLDPGDRLKQEELMEYFGVSVGPVREALRTLASEGVIVYAPRRGYRVAEVSLSEAEIVLPVRFIVEEAAFRNLRETRDEALLGELEHLVHEMHAGALRGSFKRVNDADVAFHEAVVTSCSASPQSVRLWRLVITRVRMLFNVLTPLHSDLDSVAEEHRRLLDAVQHGTADELRSLVEEHVHTQPYALLKQAWETMERVEA